MTTVREEDKLPAAQITRHLTRHLSLVSLSFPSIFASIIRDRDSYVLRIAVGEFSVGRVVGVYLLAPNRGPVGSSSRRCLLRLIGAIPAYGL